MGSTDHANADAARCLVDLLDSKDARGLTADVVVVGSGAGSSAVAGEARRRGLSVVMIEAGEAASVQPGIHLRNLMPDADFNRRAMGLLVPHARGDKPVDGLPGTRGIHAVGGMMIAWSHAVPRPQVPAEWDGPLSPSVLSDYLGRAEKVLWATDSLYGDGGRRQQWVQERIRARADIEARRVPVAARRDSLGHVEYAGAAALFDPEGTTGRMTVITDAVVRRINHRNGVAASVVAVRKGGGEFTVMGDVIVVGAGAVGTPQLLFASGLRHPALGRYATDHVNVVSSVPLVPEAPIESVDEPPMNLYVPVTDERPFHTAILDLPSVAHTGIAMGDDSLSVTNLGSFIGTEPVHDNGLDFDETELDEFGMPVVHAHIELTENDHSRIALVYSDHYGIARAIGDPRVGMTSFLRPFGSALHLMGTHRIGADEDSSVLDETGLVRGTTNVYAVGNGAIPSRNSVNPTLTTVALALHTADRIFDKGDAR